MVALRLCWVGLGFRHTHYSLQRTAATWWPAAGWLLSYSSHMSKSSIWAFSCKKSIYDSCLEARERARQERVLTVKRDDLSLIPRIHMIKKSGCPLSSTQVPWRMHTSARAHTQVEKYFKNSRGTRDLAKWLRSVCA